MIEVALVGYGYWGPNLARNFSSLPGCRLAAICDRSPERLERAAHLYPHARLTQRYDDILHDPNITSVLIATPVSFHYELTLAALLAGKDVLVEKPFTQTSEQARELVALAARLGRIIAVDHTFLYTGAVQKIKELVCSGDLGELLYFDSVRINLGLFQEDVNVIYDLAPHDLSILTHLFDKQPVAIRAMGARHGSGQQESLAYLHVEYSDDFVAHFHFSWLAPVKIRKTIIAGTRKMIVYDDLDPAEKVKVYDKGITVNPSSDSLSKIKIDYRTGDMLAPKLAHREALHHEASHFLQCVRDRTQPLADGIAGMNVVRILEASERSLQAGGDRVLLGDI